MYIRPYIIVSFEIFCLRSRKRGHSNKNDMYCIFYYKRPVHFLTTKYFVVSLIPSPGRVDSPARTTKTETPAYAKLPPIFVIDKDYAQNEYG